MPDRLSLAVDVGNSRIKFGVFEWALPNQGRPRLPECCASQAVSIAEKFDWEGILAHFEKWSPALQTAAIAGANPRAMEMILSSWPGAVWPLPFALRQAAELPLCVKVQFPNQVGIDRLLDAIAANVLRPPTAPVVVVDSGTATTVDLISSSGAFEGGAILPGLELGARALHQYTALLPLIDVQALLTSPVAAVGRNTIEAIQSGIWFGQIGSIRELVAQLTETAGQPPVVLVTGGNGRWLASSISHRLEREVLFEPDLALRGLAYVAQSAK